MIKPTLCCVLTVCCLSMVYSQSVTDTSFVRIAARKTADIYKNFISVHSGLINGSEYAEPPLNENQFPYYQQVDWLTGGVYYNNEYYSEVSMMYDLSTDNLVAENPVNGQEIQLVKSRVSSFTLNGDQFVHMRKQQLTGLPQEGFYQVLHDGKSSVLVRHIKIFEEKIENSQIVFYYLDRKRTYVRTGDLYVRVSKKGDLLKLFGDKKDEVRGYMRKNKLRISRKDPHSFSTLVAYYDTL
jgi:hypothetical protein